MAEVVKPLHRHRIWNHLIAQSDTQNTNNQGKPFTDFVPYGKWSVPHDAISEVQKRFVHFTTKVVDRQDSAKGDTTKLLIQLQDGHLIETVIMQHHNYRTVCLSSQIGCKMGCKFCATGTMGIIGNLTAGEIIEQVVHANAISKIRNIVFMGMGEPLNNMEALCTTLDFLVDTRTFSLAPRHVTVSTVGVVKNMRRLTDQYPTVNLALSLHAPNQEVRLKIVPSASAHKYEVLLAELDHRIAAWNRLQSKSRGERLPPPSFGDGEEEDSSSVNSASTAHTAGTGTMVRSFKKKIHSSGIMIEYILIKDVNVLPEHAHELGRVLSSRREDLLLNLIPSTPQTSPRTSSRPRRPRWMPSTPSSSPSSTVSTAAAAMRRGKTSTEPVASWWCRRTRRRRPRTRAWTSKMRLVGAARRARETRGSRVAIGARS